VAVCLIALALVIVAERSHTADEPFERDIASHAVIAHEMLAGRSLYSDLWDSKPPAVWITYGAAELIFGYGPQQVFWLAVAAAMLTMAGVFSAVRKVTGPAAAVLAAAIWAVVCGDLRLWANQPNIEVFMNVALVWAFGLLLRARNDVLDWPRVVTIGVLSFLASLFKPVAAAIVVAWAIAHVLLAPTGRAGRKTAIAQMAIVAAVAASGWALVFGYFAGTGRGRLFFDTIVRYGASYTTSRGGNVLTNTLTAFGPRGLFNVALSGVWPVAVLFVAAAAVGLAKGPRRPWGLVLAFAIGAQIAVGLPGRWSAHYFQLLLPVFAVAAGLAYGAVLESGEGGIGIGLRFASVAVLIVLAGMQLNNYGLSAEDWSVKKYGRQFVVARHLGERLAALLRPDEEVYVWGINPEIYFWSRKRPPVGAIWAWDTFSGPLASTLARQTVEDLERRPPRVVVANLKQLHPPPGHPVVDWFERRYILVPGGSPDDLFAVWALPDPGLRSRLSGVTREPGGFGGLPNGARLP